MAKKRLVLRERCSGDERSEMRIKKYVAKFGALLATASLAFGTAVVLPGTAAAGGSHCPKYPIPSSHSKCGKGGNHGHGQGKGKGNGKGGKHGGKGGNSKHHHKHHHKKHHHKH
jgi:hypothetical protein